MWLGTSYGILASRASLFSKPGLASKCRRALEKAVELDAKDFEAVVSLSNYYLLAPGFLGGGADKAVKLAQDFAAYDPFRAALLEAQDQEHEKKWPEAGAALRRAITIQPDSLDANLRLGTVLVSAGEYEQAFAHYTKLASEQPANIAAVQFHIGRAAAISGLRAEEGIEALRAFIAASEGKRGPSPADGYFRLGMIEEKRGHVADARAAYETALKLEPKNRGAADALKKLK
jgi:cytochrome c-type biogenesis protein CcmH/NrfG